MGTFFIAAETCVCLLAVAFTLIVSISVIVDLYRTPN